tara:strand:- start:7979 stop:8683 length:705 start_codon:yes stop_codon:yes gene_type:complete
MHSISVAICQESKPLTQQLTNNNFRFFSKNGYLVIAAQKGIRKVLSGFVNQSVFAYTDYYAGCGEQSARFIDFKTNKEERFNSINQALKKLGVKRTSDLEDEFDFVGLGSIRLNEDIEPKNKTSSVNQTKDILKSTTEEQIQFLLDNGWFKTDNSLRHNQLGQIPLKNEFLTSFVKQECVRLLIEKDNENHDYYFNKPLQEKGYKIKSYYPLILEDQNGGTITGRAVEYIKNNI